MRRLMVGTDGSVSGQVAVAWAAGVAQATDADLVVASAWKPSQAEVPPETYERLRAEARRNLDDECSSAREAGIKYEARILDGDPRSELDLVGVAEVAELLRVSRQRVHQLIQERPDFPEPVAHLRAGKIWLRQDITQWARPEGRRPAGP